jgi:hypothetical protein
MSVRRFADLPTRVSHNPTYRYDADDGLSRSQQNGLSVSCLPTIHELAWRVIARALGQPIIRGGCLLQDCGFNYFFACSFNRVTERFSSMR